MSARAGHIGPNVLIQTAEALSDRLGRDATERLVFAATHFALDGLPQEMVHESHANALMRWVLDERGPRFMRGVMREAGQRTGDYLLANRIPRVVRWTLPHAPAPLALRVLMTAISRNSWTFAGSAQVHITLGDPSVITLRHCPLCAGRHSVEPICDFYTGTFSRLMQQLVGPKAWAEEVSCEARGDSSCRFLLGTGR